LIDFKAVVDGSHFGLFNTRLAFGQVAQLVEQRTEKNFVSFFIVISAQILAEIDQSQIRKSLISLPY
jgi:hypothetical protein